MDGFQQRSEKKKHNILQAALRLFLQNGIKRVSVAKIAKEANVSQVTIYNYFSTKKNLVHAVITHYIDKEWEAYERLLHSDLPFPKKIKQIIFEKKAIAADIHEDFYQYIMKDYASESNYVEKMYQEKAIPGLICLFNEGREAGYIDPNFSDEAILFYIHMLKEYMQQKDVYEKILPLTEDITKLFFYGIMGKATDNV